MVALLATVTMPGGGQAQTTATATATTHLNVRAGPGSQHPVIGVIPPDGRVTKERCRGRWCEVRYNDLRGWAYAEYLEAAAAEDPDADKGSSDATAETGRDGPAKARPENGEPIVIYTPPGDGGAANDSGIVGAGRLLGGPAEQR